MEQNLIHLEKTLKENYLKAFINQIGVEPTAILGKIKKVPLVSNKIVAVAPIGLSGGFGFGAEGQATPEAGNVKYDRFETEAKDMYVNIAISAKTVRLANDKGAMINALDEEVRASYKTAKWNMGRSLFGNGTGVLAKISALTDAGLTITVDDTKNLKEGLIIDIYAEGATVPQTNGKGRRIVAVNRANKTVTIEGTASTFTKGFITVQNSYNREITGLGTIFDTSVTKLYGLNKADNPYLAPITVDAGQDIDDGIITKALRQAKNDKNSAVDTLLCGDDAFDAYVTYLRTNNVRVEDMSHTISGGFKAIKFIFGNKEVDIINESFVPSGDMWGVDSTSLELHTQEWAFADLQGGGIFNLMEGSSVYRALLCNYGDLICKNPGGCVRIHNIA